jgi:hypothetical protein
MRKSLRFLSLLLLGALAGSAVATERIDVSNEPFTLAIHEVQRHDPSWDESYLVTLELPHCSSLENDGDLGPFIASAKKHGESTVIVFVPVGADQPVQAVFFHDGRVVAYSRRAGKSKDPLKEIEAARVEIKDVASPSGRRLSIEPGNILADDGSKVGTLHVRIERGPAAP